MGPDPAVAAVRLAVRRALGGIETGARVLVACSGGADSLALAGALAFEAGGSGHRAGAITVDHGLQEGSAARAASVVTVMRRLGLDPAEVRRVEVGRAGGPEAAAREARYAAFDAAVAEHRAAAVLLGHTLDDQAETVLLGLARGSGARSLAGMAPVSGRYHRPLLGLDRDLTRRACLAMDLIPWDDPHNADPAYARVRVRRDALPELEKALGPGVAGALARTARLLRDDADALDSWAARVLAEARTAPGANTGAGPDAGHGADAGSPAGTEREAYAGPEAGTEREAYAGPEAGTEPGAHAGSGAGTEPGAHAGHGAVVALRVAVLAGLPRAVRTRVIRRAAIEAGSPPGTLAAVHVAEVDALVTAWRGQSRIDLPGKVRAWRGYEKLLFGPSESS